MSLSFRSTAAGIWSVNPPFGRNQRACSNLAAGQVSWADRQVKTLVDGFSTGRHPAADHPQREVATRWSSLTRPASTASGEGVTRVVEHRSLRRSRQDLIRDADPAPRCLGIAACLRRRFSW